MLHEDATLPGIASVEDIEVRLLLEAIHSRYGYDLRGYTLGSMRRRVLAALERSGLESLGALQHAVLNDPRLFAAVLDDLTVRVSELFRNPEFFHAFRTHVVPILRTYPMLRVWHAGCATGEEVYTTAIILMEEGLYDRSQIYATDINLAALDRARQGTYAGESVAALASNYARSGGTRDLSEYHASGYDCIAMKERLRRNIMFMQHDLVSDHVFGEMHVIFCRNVLIYFGRELRTRVLAKLGQSLCPGGFLCLGSSERLTELRGPGRTDAVFTDFVRERQIYRYTG